jgi:hypothetical protein
LRGAHRPTARQIPPYSPSLANQALDNSVVTPKQPINSSNITLTSSSNEAKLLGFSERPIISSNITTTAFGATVLFVQGRVEYLKLHSEVWLPCTNKLMLFPGDQVRTLQDSRASLRMSNMSVVRIYELSTMTIRDSSKNQGQILEISTGKGEIDGGGDMHIKTPSGSAEIKG